jgi:hypothetical protein
MMDTNQLAAVDRLIRSNRRLAQWITENDLSVFRVEPPPREAR